MKKTISTIILGLSLNMANAGINIMFNNVDAACADLTGRWVGIGYADAGIAKCEYSGEGNFAGAEQFTTTMTFKKKKGSFLCPSTKKLTLVGSCHAQSGEITVKNSEAELAGILDTDNLQANLTGYIKLSGAKASLNVSMHKE